MIKPMVIVSALGALAFVPTAAAAPPIRDAFTVHQTIVDTATCDFPVVQDWDFTNDITEWFDADGNETALQLHQSSVGTLTGNGTTLRLNIHETIFVDFVNGIPVSAKHVGVLDKIIGPDGPVFLENRPGRVFQVRPRPQQRFLCRRPGPRQARTAR